MATTTIPATAGTTGLATALASGTWPTTRSGSIRSYDPYYSGGGYYGGGGGSGGYSYQGSRASLDSGGLRLKIKPREAKVYIDGYFVGTVDSFDGMFQKLDLEAGGHRIEIRADGYETLQFEVLVTARESVTYKGELKRIQ